MTRYIWKLNNQDICGMGLESCVLSLRSGGPDTLAWTYERDISGAAPFAVHDIVTLICQTYDEEEDEITEVKTMFKGRVASCQASDTARSSGWQITAENGWGDLRRVVMTTPVKSWNPESRVVEDKVVSRVILGMDGGELENTGDIIRRIVTCAADAGAMIVSGTISPSLEVPPAELVDTSCDAAMRRFLAFHPDHVSWIEDGDKLHIRPRPSLTNIEIDPCAVGAEVDIDPLKGDVPGGVVLTWERTHDHDGTQKLERIIRTAGSGSGWPPPIRMTIPLAGATLQSKYEVIETRTLPVPGSTSADMAKLFLKGVLPQLEPADNDDLLITEYKVEFADLHLDAMDEEGNLEENERPVDREGTVDDYPRMLVSGQVQPWFPDSVKQYDARLVAHVDYKGNVAEVRRLMGGRGMDIDEAITITNALPRVYSDAENITMGEHPIEGLETSYWNEIKTPISSGRLRCPIGALYRDLRPGRTVQVTGRMSQPAPITSASLDLIADTTAITFGPSEYRNPKAVVDLARTMANLKTTWVSDERANEAETQFTTREGGKASKQTVNPRVERAELWGLQVTDVAAGKVRLANPGRVRKTMALDASGALTIVDVTVEFTAAAGKFLLLEYTPTLEVTLKLSDQWTGWPFPIDTEESTPPGLWVMTKGYHVLWEFVESSSEATAMVVRRDVSGEPILYAERRGYRDHLIFHNSWMEDKDGHVVPYYELVPGQGCRES